MRRLVITVCPRERGVVALPVERGGRRERVDALGIADRLEAVIARRALGDLVTVQRACAGGCSGPGPNVSLAFYAVPRPGEKADNVALGWKTYIGSIATLDCLAQVVDDHVTPAPAPRAGGRARRRAAR